MKLLVLCTGNICRSPMAQGVLEHLLERKGLTDRISVDSAGTHAEAWAGAAPEPMAVEVAASHGIDISGQRARQFHLEDFLRFDAILAMDRYNFQYLSVLHHGRYGAAIDYFLGFGQTGRRREVPDPFRKSLRDFEKAFDIIKAGAKDIVRGIAFRS